VTPEQLDEIWRRIESALIARSWGRDSTIILDLSRLTPEQKREIARAAVEAVEDAGKG
jgi:hypothetical protein